MLRNGAWGLPHSLHSEEGECVGDVGDIGGGDTTEISAAF